MEKNLFDVVCQNMHVTVTICDFERNKGQQVCVYDDRKYISYIKNMKKCPKWGVFYSHDPDIECTTLTQEEFDAYTYNSEKNGHVTNCCNGLVHRIKLFMSGFESFKQCDWKIETFTLGSFLNDDAWIDKWMPDIDMVEFEKYLEKAASTSNSKVGTPPIVTPPIVTPAIVTPAIVTPPIVTPPIVTSSIVGKSNEIICKTVDSNSRKRKIMFDVSSE